MKKQKKNRMNKVNLMENLQMLLMVLPGVLFLIVFQYLPLPGIAIAFKKYNPYKGIFGSPWVGLKNFAFFFSSLDAA